MSVVDTLRARFRPEWKTRSDLAGLDTMLEDALSFIAAPKAMKSKLEAPGALNSRGVEEALRRELGKNVIPELCRTRRIVAERKDALKHERARPKGRSCVAKKRRGPNRTR
jgi:hypothetical protein